MMMTWLLSMHYWLKTFLKEKGISRATVFRMESGDGVQIVTLETVEEYLSTLDREAQEKVKDKLLLIDSQGGNVLLYLQHIARVVAAAPSLRTSRQG
jgi:hypothetical protein